MNEVLALGGIDISMAVRAKVTSAFKEAFSLQDDESVEGMRYREDPRWDSVGHMILIAALESHFDTVLEVAEILAMADYHKAAEIMATHARD